MPRKSRIATAANPGPARPVDEKLSINLGCVEGLDATQLPFEVFDGASI